MSGRVVHFEVPYDDEARATAFYRDIFEWNIQKWSEDDYLLVTTGPTSPDGMPTEPGFIGGGMLPRPEGQSGPVIVLAVGDIDATLAQVEAKGGSTVLGKQPIGQMGFAAYFTDPEGNVMGLWENAD